jgi:tRNA G18 (ribose-2'-O)-methylase SpoU
MLEFTPPDISWSKGTRRRLSVDNCTPRDRRVTIRATELERGSAAMNDFIHQRHKPLAPLDRPRELIVACAPLRTNVNLSRIVRVAGCSGVPRVIACGTAKVIDKIARDGADTVEVEIHRSLGPVLKQLKTEGYVLVGLEQTSNSQSLHAFSFARKTALVVGNERLGLTDEELRLLDHVVEIPVYGLPHSYNVATAAAMALYEYCRQYPRG